MQALYIGGPTVILTIGGLRLMTDPTLDPAGHSYPTGGGKFTLEKAQSPATTVRAAGGSRQAAPRAYFPSNAFNC